MDSVFEQNKARGAAARCPRLAEAKATMRAVPLALVSKLVAMHINKV